MVLWHLKSINSQFGHHLGLDSSIFYNRTIFPITSTGWESFSNKGPSKKHIPPNLLQDSQAYPEEKISFPYGTVRVIEASWSTSTCIIFWPPEGARRTTRTRRGEPVHNAPLRQGFNELLEREVQFEPCDGRRDDLRQGHLPEDLRMVPRKARPVLLRGHDTHQLPPVDGLFRYVPNVYVTSPTYRAADTLERTSATEWGEQGPAPGPVHGAQLVGSVCP